MEQPMIRSKMGCLYELSISQTSNLAILLHEQLYRASAFECHNLEDFYIIHGFPVYSSFRFFFFTKFFNSVPLQQLFHFFLSLISVVVYFLIVSYQELRRICNFVSSELIYSFIILAWQINNLTNLFTGQVHVLHRATSFPVSVLQFSLSVWFARNFSSYISRNRVLKYAGKHVQVHVGVNTRRKAADTRKPSIRTD